MISKRIKAIADDVLENDIVLDVGCDHGYLSIYLKENKLCKEVYASDISQNALKVAEANIKKANLDIKCFVSDGFNNIPVNFNTAIIAGVGTQTILDIINNDKCPPKLILASNNEHYLLRSSLNKMGFKIVDEQAVLEKGHYYIILLCIKGKQKLNKKELKFGISNNDEYYEYLINKNKELINIVPFKKRWQLKRECRILKGLIEKK